MAGGSLVGGGHGIDTMPPGGATREALGRDSNGRMCAMLSVAGSEVRPIGAIWAIHCRTGGEVSTHSRHDIIGDAGEQGRV